MKLTVNGKQHEVDVSDDMPLLWVLRDELGITGPKFGCGIAMCGACTVHVDGNPIRSCSYPVSAAAGRSITTIEGLNNEHPLQEAWVEEQVPHLAEPAARCAATRRGAPVRNRLESVAPNLRPTPPPERPPAPASYPRDCLGRRKSL